MKTRVVFFTHNGIICSIRNRYITTFVITIDDYARCFVDNKHCLDILYNSFVHYEIIILQILYSPMFLSVVSIHSLMMRGPDLTFHTSTNDSANPRGKSISALIVVKLSEGNLIETFVPHMLEFSPNVCELVSATVLRTVVN